MARQAVINTAEDMRWLREVHLPRLPAKYKSAIIVGNEDFPDRIEVYARRDPLVTDVPVIFEADDEGVFQEKRSSVHHATMLQFPRWRVDVTVGGDLVKTTYEAATTSKAAIAKAKHKLRGAVSSAGAFKFKATRVEAGEPEQKHATKKAAAQLDREITEALSQSGSKYPRWRASYSNDEFDRAQDLATRLTNADRAQGRPAPRHGYSTERFQEATRIVRAAKH